MADKLRLVVVESPFSGDFAGNSCYLKQALADCFKRGEAPFATHGLYTHPAVLDDTDPEQHKLSVLAGFLWARHPGADTRVFYIDRGVSCRMMDGVEEAKALGQSIEVRSLDHIRGPERVAVAEKQLRCKHNFGSEKICVHCDWFQENF